MVNLGIIGSGNVVIAQHFPLLMANSDVNVSWVLEPYNDLPLMKGLNIPVFKSLDEFDNFPSVDIVFIGAPYGVRPPIYDAIRGKVKGIYCEKPFAKSVKEHLAITNDYEDYAFSIGYNRRALGHVNIIKNIIHHGVFGDLKEVRCEYSYFTIKSGSFHSHVELSGGGILFESGVHWIDAMLFSIQPNDVEIINAMVEYNAGLDIHNDAEFLLKMDNQEDIDCKILITHLQKTEDKISYVFEHVTVELYLYDESQPPLVIPHNASKNKTFEINNFLVGIGPSTAVGQGAKYWEDYISSFVNKKISYTNASECLMTTKVIEQIYGF